MNETVKCICGLAPRMDGSCQIVCRVCRRAGPVTASMNDAVDGWNNMIHALKSHDVLIERLTDLMHEIESDAAVPVWTAVQISDILKAVKEAK